MKTTKLLLILAIFCAGNFAFGQEAEKSKKDASQSGSSALTEFRDAKKWSVGLQISGTDLYGDVDNYGLGLAFGAHIKYSISQTFGLKAYGTLGTLRGTRANQNVSRNSDNDLFGGFEQDDEYLNNSGNQSPSKDSYQFENSFWDLGVQTVFTLGNISFLRPLRKLQMFVFTGAGIIGSNVTGDFDDVADANQFYSSWGDDYFTPQYDQNNNLVNAESRYRGVNFAIPFGIGIKRNFGRWLDLGLEYRMNYTRSDNLDGFSFPIWRNRFTDFYSVLGLQGSIKIGAKGEDNHYDWLNPVESLYDKIDSLNDLKDKVDLVLKDTDGDGVADYFDKDNETPEGVHTYGDGIAVDIDQDGVPDHEDDELFSDKGAEVDARGVMPDADKDGVPDYRDLEKNSPSNFVDRNGRVITNQAISGGDRNVGGNNVTVGSNACCDCNDVILPSVIFDHKSSTIKPEFYGVLYNIAAKMKECPELNVSAIAYRYGSKTADQAAWKRANSIIDHIVTNYGISRDRFNVDTNQSGNGIEYGSRRVDMRQSSTGGSNPAPGY